jgi:hypothetical protein
VLSLALLAFTYFSELVRTITSKPNKLILAATLPFLNRFFLLFGAAHFVHFICIIKVFTENLHNYPKLLDL